MRMNKLLGLIIAIVLLAGLGSCDDTEPYGKDFDLPVRDLQIVLGEKGEVDFIYGFGNYQVKSQDESIATGIVTELSPEVNKCRLVITPVSQGRTVVTVSNGFDEIDVDVAVIDPYDVYSVESSGYSISADPEISEEVADRMAKTSPLRAGNILMFSKDKAGTIIVFTSYMTAEQGFVQDKGTYSSVEIDGNPGLVLNLNSRSHYFVVTGKDSNGSYHLTENLTEEYKKIFGEGVGSVSQDFAITLQEDSRYLFPIE